MGFDELFKKEDLTHLEPENEFDFEEIEFPSDEFISPVIVDEEAEPMSDAELEEQRLKNLKSRFRSQQNVKIGCCNGLPYNSSKRCCCRRIPFDKERKFCCAINGCESFQIFDRSNKQHYKDCLSLSGLVIQEYGYRGQAGQPTMQRKTVRGRPQ